MDITVSPLNRLRGSIAAPPSKSYAQRAIALCLLVDRISIYNLGGSEDEAAALDIVKSCNATIQELEGGLVLTNHFDFNSDLKINCHESGLSTRLFSIFLGLNNAKLVVEGEGSLLLRDLKEIGDFYATIHGDFESNNNRLPLHIRGRRVEEDIVVDGSTGSQHITGILYYMVGLRSKKELNLTIENPMSLPYIDMSIEYLKMIGAKISWASENLIRIEPSALRTESEVFIEGDWSSAAFWIVAAAINGRVQISNLNSDSIQADKSVLDVLRMVGATCEWQNSNLVIEKGDLKSFEFDATHCPDLIPILTVLGLFCEGTTRIEGIDRLANKESNRLVAIMVELIKVSDGIHSEGNFIFIDSSKYKSGMDELVFDSHQDHRIAMSLCILALNLKNKSIIRGFDCINKSYPNFLKDLNQCIN